MNAKHQNAICPQSERNGSKRQGPMRNGVGALVALNIAAFSAAIWLAVGVPDALDAAASAANAGQATVTSSAPISQQHYPGGQGAESVGAKTF